MVHPLDIRTFVRLPYNICLAQFVFTWIQIPLAFVYTRIVFFRILWTYFIAVRMKMGWWICNRSVNSLKASEFSKFTPNRRIWYLESCCFNTIFIMSNNKMFVLFAFFLQLVTKTTILNEKWSSLKMQNVLPDRWTFNWLKPQPKRILT